jgi:hypothetical protein
MRPTSSTFSFDRRSGLWPLVFLAAVFAAILALSEWQLQRRGLARHREDQVVHQMSQWRGVQARAVILADSVTAGAVYAARPAPGVVPLVTNGYLRLAGQYFILRRYLEHNSTEYAYLFMLPALVAEDISDEEGGGMVRYTYVDTIFTRPYERQVLDEAGASPRKWSISWFDRLFRSWYPNHAVRPFWGGWVRVANEPSVLPPEFGGRVPPRLTRQTTYLLREFEKLCQQASVRCVLVQEPTAPGTERFDMSVLQAEFPGMRFLDTHDYGTFPREAFFDGLHFEREWGRRYLSFIQQNIAPLFDHRLPEWDGRRLTLSSPEGLGHIESDAFHNPESWGVWLSKPSSLLRFRFGNDSAVAAIRIGLAVAPRPGAPDTPVAVFLGDERVWNGTLPADGQLRDIAIPLAADTPLVAGDVALRFDVPGTIRPVEMGIGGDDRMLSVGLSYIELDRSRPASPKR